MRDFKLSFCSKGPNIKNTLALRTGKSSRSEIMIEMDSTHQGLTYMCSVEKLLLLNTCSTPTIKLNTNLHLPLRSGMLKVKVNNKDCNR